MDRLASIGLALIDFAFLVARFIGHRFDYIIRRGDSGWVFLDGRYLSDWSLVRHLGGDIIVGTGCRYDAARRILATPYIAVDIDHAGDATDLRDRYDRVLQALGRPSYVLRSSDSGGLHVYYLLTRAENLHVLRSFDGCRGDVMRLLRARGVREEKGRIEVYPRGQYKDRGPQPRLRAPFGAGSGVLDVETLEPVAGAGAQSLVWARDSFERGKVRVVDPTEWRSACRELPPEPAPIRERRKTVTKRPARRGQEPSGRAPTGHDAAKVQEYLTHGLTGRRQLNAAASALAFHFRFGERMEREEAIGAMLAWLESQHNGMSATYNASPARARRQVSGVVERVYRGDKLRAERRPAKWAPLPGLSAWEARMVLRTFEHDADTCDPSTGEPLDVYKLQKFAFELVRRGKQFVVTTIGNALAGAVGGPAANVDAQIASVWPDRSKLEFIVPVPSALRTGTRLLDGVARDTRWALWRAVLNTGLFRLERPGSEQARRCATYRVRLDLDFLTPEGRTFSTIDAALAEYVSPAERRVRYTRYRCRQLAAVSDEQQGGSDERVRLTGAFVAQEHRQTGAEDQADAAA